MKKILFISVLVFASVHLYAQNPAVTRNLQSRYGSAQWRTECRGWYLVSYTQNGTNFYGFADAEGNMVASNAVKYKVYKGFIEMQVFDRLKQQRHDNWEKEMAQYQKDYDNYVAKNKQHENRLEAYKANVEAAKQEAENRWNAARQMAYNNAVIQARAANARLQAGTTTPLGALLTGVLSGVNEVVAGKNAANSVQYEPIEERVLAERNLLTPPSAPYNPKPTKPTEPPSGYEWKTIPLLQPCPYTELDYSSLKDPNGYSKALKDGQYWGIVNSSLVEVIPCRYSEVTPCGNLYSVCRDGKYGLMDLSGHRYAPEKYSSIRFDGGMFIVNENGKYGLLSQSGAVVMPCLYEMIEPSNGYMMCRINGLWGVYTKEYEELYPCQFQQAEFLTVGSSLLLRTKVKGQWGVIDFNSGTQLLPNSYGRIEPYSLFGDTVFKVYRDGKVGVYYSNGVLLLPAEFSSIRTETVGEERCLEVEKDGYVGLYDMDGAVIISPGRYNSYQYHNNFFYVTAGGKKGVCSLYGEELVTPEYSEIEFIAQLAGFFVKKDGKCGIVDIRGQLAFPMISANDIEYDLSMPNVIIVKNGYKENGAISADGSIVLDPKYRLDKIDDKVEAAERKNNLEQIRKQKIEERSKLYDDYLASQSAEKARRETFSFFARNYVERIINDWQRRGEFEKMSDWQARVNDKTRQQKVYALTRTARDYYLETNTKNIPKDKPSIVGRYDPDNETYMVKTAYADHPILVRVPTDDAEEFKADFAQFKRTANFQVKDDGIELLDYSFTMPNGNVYRYHDQDNAAYSAPSVDYSFEHIDLGNLAGKVSTSSMKFGTSDVDKNIPMSDKVRDKTFAVVIANENYLKEKDVEFAYNDGMAFSDYCVKAMGIPASNVHFKPNATLNDMRFEFNWIKKVAEDFKGEAEFIVYYAGHGIPDDASKEAFLLPVDGTGEDLESAYRLSKLYGMLGEIPSRDVMVFLDACFSGSQRNGEVLASSRGVAVRPQITAPTGNMVVYSAVTDKETAFPYREKVHGLFTYYILKKMQSTDGNLNFGELSDYVSDEVSRKSIVVNSKPQHPTVNPSSEMVYKWRNLEIK